MTHVITFWRCYNTSTVAPHTVIQVKITLFPLCSETASFQEEVYLPALAIGLGGCSFFFSLPPQEIRPRTRRWRSPSKAAFFARRVSTSSGFTGAQRQRRPLFSTSLAARPVCRSEGPLSSDNKSILFEADMQMRHFYANRCVVSVTVFLLSLGDLGRLEGNKTESYTARHYAALLSLYLLSTWITALIPHCTSIPAFSRL